MVISFSSFFALSVLGLRSISHSRENRQSASLNLVGNQSEHPVYDHLPVRSPSMPPMQSDAAIRNESAPHYSPGLVDCNLTLMAAVLIRRLPSTPLLMALQQQYATH